LRLGLVQERADPDAIARGVGRAAADGARLVCLQELTLSRYLDGMVAEEVASGPTLAFASSLARECGVHVVASLYESGGYNTAILVAPDGGLVTRTRKRHIPSSDGYGEDAFFRPGPVEDGLPVADVGGVRVATPTCYDQWFPELARAYAQAGAQLIVYPSAIGTEPSRPDLDTQPMWEHTIVAHGIANATFMAAVNRVGTERETTFYGSSFVSDPFGRVIARAPRDEPAVLVADLDLSLCDEWRRLFPFDRARRPAT
jgi:N-carbamoylputrescine amidase